MKNDFGLYLDTNVVVGGCAYGTWSELFHYLRDNPGLGQISEKNLRLSRKIIGKSPNSYAAFSEYNKLSTYLKVENFEGPEFRSKVDEVNELFFNIINENRPPSNYINPSGVSWRYKHLVKRINDGRDCSYNEQKIFRSLPEREDAERIAEAIFMPCAHRIMTSEDGHISNPFTSKLFQEKFGISIVHPSKALPELKKYEHLFKEKMIS